LPTSVLREIAHLKSVDHPNIVKVEHAEVKSEVATIVYKFHDYNLKEFIRKYAKSNPLQAAKIKGEKSSSYLSLDYIKSIMF
jgi:serine/threonine protein kinase